MSTPTVAPETDAVSPADAFTAEILRSYLVSTVKEMVLTTTRTAYSTCFCHGEVGRDRAKVAYVELSPGTPAVGQR